MFIQMTLLGGFASRFELEICTKTFNSKIWKRFEIVHPEFPWMADFICITQSSKRRKTKRESGIEIKVNIKSKRNACGQHGNLYECNEMSRRLKRKLFSSRSRKRALIDKRSF